jgi:hypothetical protein
MSQGCSCSHPHVHADLAARAALAIANEQRHPLRVTVSFAQREGLMDA